jgi:uncharacterized protein
MSGDLPVRILRAADRAALPWKNGGGVTREVAVHPPGSGLGAFDWRVSIAQVHSSGPFSAFPGVDRRLAVLEGRLSLSIDGRDALSLSPDTSPVAFPGDVTACAAPLEEAVTDLNVMTRRGRFDARMTRHMVRGAAQLPLCPGTALILALSLLRVRCRGGEWDLSPLDAALIEGAAHCELLEREPPGSFWLVELSVRAP